MWGGHTCMASAERKLKRRSGGRAPSEVHGQSPWSGVMGTKPFEAENLSVFRCPTAAANCRQILRWRRTQATGESSSKPDRFPLPLTRFASISETTSCKSEVDMSTPVHSVATPLNRARISNRYAHLASS